MPAQPPYKILHICKVYLPVRGGVQRVVSLLTSLLSEFSHHVITTGEDGAIQEQMVDGVRISRCRSWGQIASMPLAPSLIPMSMRRFRQQDLIAIHYPFPLAEVALLFCFSSPPIVVHWHSNIVAQRKLRWLVVPFTYLMLIRAKAIVITSNAMLENSRMLKFFDKKTRIFPYGVEKIHVSPASSLLEKPYFVLIGRHVSYKGIDIAINALQHTELTLIIIGDGPLFERHKKLAEDIQVADRVVFVQRASDREVSKLLQNSIALVTASNQENEAFALVQLEAMRLRKSIINTSLKSSVPWVARHMQEAITVPPNDVCALTDAMQLLSNDQVLCERLGKNGWQRYLEEFTAQTFADKSRALYLDIIITNK